MGTEEERERFWEAKSLDEMTAEEWESLCDGCGLCCLIKLQDEETDELFHTKVACRLLDIGSCTCNDYPNRHARVTDCIEFNAESVRESDWLPPSCAYRLVDEGRDLYWWHPLISGSRETVHEAGVSVRGWTRSETSIDPELIQRYVIRDPFGRKSR